MREIAYYQRLDQAGRVHWIDVSTDEATCPDGYCQMDLLKRFHVQCAQGHMYSGASGFARLWLELPGFWRYAGQVAMVTPVTVMLEWAYRVFLPLRPALQRMARQRLKRRLP